MLSTYTICSNPLSEYYPIKEMVLSNLQFADEVVVADFDSTDGTLELLNYIQEDIKKNLSKYYGRLKIVIGDTKYENTEYFYTEAKNQALDACTNDWVVRIDADEIIPEWSFEKIKELSTDKKAYAFRFKRLHFYKDYNTIKVIPKDKIGYTYMFRKSTTARHKYVVGNCDGLIKTSNNTFFDDLGIPVDVTVFHYSWCRPVKILLKRMQRIEKKLIPFSELRKKQYPNNYKIEQVNDWFKIDSSLTDEEIEKKIFDMRGTTLYGGKHPLLMYEKIKLGMTVDTTYHKVLEPECKMGISLNNYQDNSKNVNICSDICSIPKISTYISTINSLFYQSTLEQTIRQSLLFSDEIIVVNSSNSSDGTQELLDTLKSEYPNIIKLYTYKEPDIIDQKTLADRKTFALSKCAGQYCILQDDDEMIHEQYAEYIKLLPKICPDTLAFRFNTIHFYRSYNRYQTKENWYSKKIYMVKNNKGIMHGLVGTDPDNHIIYDNNRQKYMPLDSLESPKVINTPITDYHYGWANRNDAILLFKKYMQELQWWGHHYWKSHEFPFKFDNPETLPEFTDKEGHPKFMRYLIEHENKFNSKRIKEFTK